MPNLSPAVPCLGPILGEKKIKKILPIIYGYQYKTELSPRRELVFIVEPSMSDHGLETLVLVTQSSMFQCGN